MGHEPDVDYSDNFTKSLKDSSLDGDCDDPAYYAGCYAIMQAGGNLALIAPNCPVGYGGCPAGGQIWDSGLYAPSVLYTQPGSFGPFLAFPSNGGELKIANAAGYQIATNPAIDTPHRKNGLEIGKEILSYVLVVVGAFP